MKISRRITALAGLAVVLAVPAAAHAQTFNFYTTGQFGGSCATAEAVTVTCGPATAGGPQLEFTGQPVRTGGNYLSGSNIVFGQFLPSGIGDQTVPAGVTFTLFVHQTDPTSGDTHTSGPVTGRLVEMAGGNGSSTLVWTPDSYAFSIGAVSYFITPVAPIAIGDQGTTSINGKAISSVPEPSSMALLGTGLVGLVPMIRRKKQS